VRLLVEGRRGMDFLALKLAWWLVAAFAIGLVIGWLSCSQETDGQP
jgi:hypothetical protein